jgi:hypothetical protein
VKYADDLVLLTKEETVLWYMIDKLTETGRCYGTEMNVENTKAMRISRHSSSVQNTIHQKQLDSVEYFKYLDRMITSDARWTREIISRIAMAKASFSCHHKWDLNLRKKLVKCYIWSIALYGAETWTLRKVDQKYLESLKYGAGEVWRRLVGPIV